MLPILSRPFNGDFVLATYFDHGPDNDGYLLTSCGERVTYGGRGDGHRAYDWGARSVPVGTPLLATFDGTVVSTATTSCDQLNVIIEFSDPLRPYRVWYAHLDRVDVAEGQSVKSGQVIGLAGTTGCLTSPDSNAALGFPSIHFEVFAGSAATVFGGSPVDPYGWEGRIPDPWARQPGGGESVWLWRPGEAPRLQPCCLR